MYCIDIDINKCTVSISISKTARKDKTITTILSGVFLEKLRVAEAMKFFACYEVPRYITPCLWSLS